MAPSRYQRRTPETSVLYQVVADHLESLLDDARARSAHGFGLPRHVEAEFRRYLACGQLAHGFVRARCSACGLDRLVAFSCKGRALCPSCRGRRMTDVGAHLVDHVLPSAPYRQWTLTVPFALRLAMARDRALLSRVLGIFLRSVFVWQRAAARAAGLPDPRPGAVTAIQRFGSALNLNVHFHALVPDGVFVATAPGAARFAPLPRPTDADVAWICARVVRRVLAHLAADADGRDDECDANTALLAESVRPAARASSSPAAPTHRRHLTASIDGFTVHADTDVAAADRAALERLVRYGARPPFAHQRLARTASGKIAYRLRRPWSSGQTEIVLEPVALLRRLAALIPPPRQHQLRYHGVFAGRAADRAAIAQLVPPPDVARPSAHHRPARPPTGSPPPHRLAARRLPWAELFRRAFREDLLVCPRCDGPVVIIAALIDPGPTRRVLVHLGLAADPLPIAPARAPPQHDLWPGGGEFDSADAPA